MAHLQKQRTSQSPNYCCTRICLANYGHDFDRDVILELVQRIWIPNYDKARRHLQDAIAKGIIRREQGFYRQNELKAVLRCASQGRWLAARSYRWSLQFLT